MTMPREGKSVSTYPAAPTPPGLALSIDTVAPERAPRRGTALVLGLAMVLVIQGCAPATHAVSPAAQQNPEAATAASDRVRRARIIPLGDHHQHIVGPAAASRRPESLPAVALPAPLDTLLRERGRLGGSADGGGLYTEDAQALDHSEESLPWVRGREAAATALANQTGGLRFVATMFSLDGNVAHVAGEVFGGRSTRPAATFSMGLRRDAGGRWRIATEMLTPIPEWAFERVITADDLIGNLDEAGIERAVVLSVAYWFNDEATTRAENDWTAAQVARHPGRLVAFCGIRPLQDHAVRELRRCARELGMKGIKMHFRGSRVDVLNPEHVEKVRQVFQAANQEGMAIVVHSEARGTYGRVHAEAFLEHLLPAAPDVPVQIAHLWGGNQYRPEPLAVYAAAIAAGDPRTRNLYFDLTEIVPGAGGADRALREIARTLRQIGLDRVLYGSDATTAGGAPVAQRWAQLRHRLPLTDAEMQDIADNVAPYLR
jgi:predicted TIM-barrel fold metal-dependent hydrolase